jgi:hypothetical protein
MLMGSGSVNDGQRVTFGVGRQERHGPRRRACAWLLSRMHAPLVKQRAGLGEFDGPGIGSSSPGSRREAGLSACRDDSAAQRLFLFEDLVDLVGGPLKPGECRINILTRSRTPSAPGSASGTAATLARCVGGRIRLVELSVVEQQYVEQRYRAVLAGLAGAPVVDVATRRGVTPVGARLVDPLPKAGSGRVGGPFSKFMPRWRAVPTIRSASTEGQRRPWRCPGRSAIP